ncbi:MAG: beta-propeller domain-containing protein [Aliiglaciecola sp.]
MTFRILYIAVVPTLALLTACGGSSSDDPEPIITVPQVNAAKGFDGPLAQGKASTFIRNGIYATTVASTSAPSTPTTDAAPATPAPENNFSFSGTNTVEQGVDEADRIKYDGETLFLATFPNWTLANQEEVKVRVLTRNEDFTLQAQTDIELAGGVNNIEGLYLHQDRLATLGIESPYYSIDTLSSLPWVYSEPEITINIHDVSDPTDVELVTEIKIDGALLSSRRIDDALFIVSNYVPYVSDIAPGAASDAEKLDTYQKILSTPSSSIMPKRYVDGQSQPLNNIEQCYVPAEATNDDGYAQILTVTKINLLEPTEIQSMCMSVYAYMMYMSEQNLYIGSGVSSEQTSFHKVQLSDLSYQASGSVQGVLNWRSDPVFKLNEKDGFLRVVSTDYSSGSPEHRLTVLSQQANELEAVAILPNQDQPEKIGKPDEDIYAVRFVDDKAYVVTFLQIDPLYVIDLTDNTSPIITGSLEIPGFSSYLHPMENDLLLGIGQQINLADIPATGEQVIAPVPVSGLKISLFDVRDPANPLEITPLVIEDAYTPVEWNYKALSALNIEGVYQFALPVEQWGNSDDIDPASTSMLRSRNSLVLLQSDSNAQDPTLDWVNSLEVENTSDTYVYSGDDRSIIHGQNVYYIRGNQVWLSSWSDGQISGPF